MRISTANTRTLGLLLLAALAASQPRWAPGANDPSPAVQRATNVDLGHGYVRRGGAIHFIGGGVTGSGAEATRIDSPSPELLKKVERSGFGPFTTCEGLDVASFEALSEEYTRDKDHVYYKVTSPGAFLVIRLPQADPDSFEVVEWNLARDRNRVWYYCSVQPGANPSTVEVVHGGQVFKDHDSVHYGYKAIAGADPASFRHLGSAYFADGNRVYWGSDPIQGADPVTLEVLEDSFIAKDKGHVYRSGRRLAGLDLETVKLILHNPAGYQILADKNGIYLNATAFPRAKPGSVEMIDKATFRRGDLVLLVNPYQNTPVTLFEEAGRLMVETPCYDPKSEESLAIIRAEVTGEGLKNIDTRPLPGNSETPSVPDWQIAVLKQPAFLRRMLEAGELITGETRPAGQQGAIDSPEPRSEEKSKEELAVVERDRLQARWLKTGSAAFERTARNLVADYGLDAAQAEEVKKIFSRREEKLADLLASMNSDEGQDGRDTVGRICALIRNKGLRGDLEGVFSAEQLEAFDAKEAKRKRLAVEARSYREMAEIHSVVQLTEAQKPRVITALAEFSAELVEREADARAFMSLTYGPLAADMDSFHVRGLANMMNLDPARDPDFEYGSAEHQNWVKERNAARIEDELHLLWDILDDDQLARYRAHLEAELPR